MSDNLQFSSGKATMTIEVFSSTSNADKNTTVECGGSDDDADASLLHPSLQAIPQSIRFSIAGGISNLIFIAGYNTAVDNSYVASVLTITQIYAVCYSIFIPINHAIVSLLVFGWPTQYVPSLATNIPQSVSAMLLGTILIGYFETIQLEQQIDQFLVRSGIVTVADEPRELYCSILVMIITGIWSYLLAQYANNTEKKKTNKKKKDTKKL